MVPAPGGAGSRASGRRTTCTSPGFRRCWRSAAPDARLLVLVRDPVERFRSGLAHHRRHAGRITADVHADAVVRGLYGRWLEQWLEHVPRDRILVLQYEQCVADPGGQLERTYRFLGLPPFSPPAMLHPRQRIGELVPLDRDVAAGWPTSTHRTSACCRRSLPDLDLDLWPSVAGSWAS